MKQFLIIILLLSFIYTAEAQHSIGLRVGYSVADFKRNPQKPYNFVSFGLPLTFNISKKIGLRITPTYLRHGTRFEKNENILFFDIEGYSYTNSLKFPLELVWKPSEYDKVFLSINAGAGYGTYLNSYNDLTLYTEDILTGEITTTQNKGKVNENVIAKSEFFAVAGFDFGPKISEKYQLNFNFSYMRGLSNLNTLPDDDEKVFSQALSFSLQLSVFIN